MYEGLLVFPSCHAVLVVRAASRIPTITDGRTRTEKEKTCPSCLDTRARECSWEI